MDSELDAIIAAQEWELEPPSAQRGPAARICTEWNGRKFGLSFALIHQPDSEAGRRVIERAKRIVARSIDLARRAAQRASEGT